MKPETSGIVADRTYEYDAAGNVLNMLDAPAVGDSEKQCFTYDTQRRLVSAWTPKTTAACSTTPTVDTLAGPAPYWTDWTIDKLGNRRTQTAHTKAGNTTKTYAVPEPGDGVVRPHAVTSVKTKLPDSTEVTGNYQYDATGNMTKRYVSPTLTQTLTWDPEGRVATVVEGTQNLKNIYDVDGSRLIHQDTSGYTLYLPGMELKRATGTATVKATRYYQFAGQVIASRTADGLQWLYTDFQGTQNTTVHASTLKVTVRRQSPYGETRGTQGMWPNNKGFVGGNIDTTGLTHLGARDYDPGLGRFVSVDPLMDLGDPQQWNGYAYSNNNPTTFSDPTGLKPDCGNGSANPTCDNAYAPAPKSGSGSGNNPDWIRKKAGQKFKPQPPRDDQGNAMPPAGQKTAEQSAEQWFNTHYTNLDVFEQAFVADDLHCYNTTGLCAAEGAAGQAAWKAFWLDMLGVTDARECLEGSVSGCVWTGIAVVPYAGKAAKFAWVGKTGSAAGDSKKVVAAAKSCLRSFSADTRVLLADGSTKKFADLRIGDEVLATDPVTGEQGPHKIEAVWIHDDDLYALAVGSGQIVTTEDHPFWNETDRRWERADKLDSGDLVRTPTGTTRVGGFDDSQHHRADAYNLTVEGLHTYYVLAGNTPVLVHNTGGCGDLGPNWKPRPNSEICDSSGCEAVARDIQQRIGGDVHRIVPPGGASNVGRYNGQWSGWGHHEVVVRDGRVYDAFTDRTGVPIDEYKARFDDMFPEEFPF